MVIENLLVNGCSFSRGPDAWPYHLRYCNIVNLAQSGTGNTYIHESTVSELAKRPYNFVVIMWTGIHRIDLKVADIDLFSESKYTSNYQYQQNDWKEKTIYPINDQDYVEKNWAFGCGHINGERALRQSKCFDGIYRYVGLEQFVDGLLIKMISLQNTLKQMKIPYLFTFYNDYEKELTANPTLYNMLDHTRIYNEENIANISKKNNWVDPDNAHTALHPGPTAHRHWATLIQSKIEEIYVTESN